MGCPHRPFAGPPPELLREIFSFAASSSASYAVDYEPFQQPRELEETSRFLELEALRLKTCLALVRVCRLWRTLSEEFLYQNVRIVSSRALENLVRGMQRSAAEEESEGFGRFIRRLELQTKPTHFKNLTNASLPFRLPCPIPISKTPTIGFSDLLRCCPRLEILVRPPLRFDADDMHFWDALVSTPIEGSRPLCPNLKRLEWSESDLDTRFFGPTNGKRLSELVAHSPNLRYLFLSSDRPDVLSHLPFRDSLHTLRLNRSHYHSSSRPVKGIQYRMASGATNLTNLVLHTMIPSTMLSFIDAVGWQLRILELMFAPQVTYSSNQMHRILSRCPNLEELVYHLGAPEISPLEAFQHTALKRVRLRINPEDWFPSKHVVRSQFEILAGPSFSQPRANIAARHF
ncbi:t-SNARE coiled-coil-like proteiny domain-containing protein [Mycena sanguinolenta]|uniref:t-SNARE coiled-coil-like proteiny domain-containing protein n=1 Tax=Mycena sanguinolenta TaxID=230812 RepID=A0A8H6YAT9_9AGAR|nr:t-SNARE coiled-coil-like proteiny domain-containing protein [Mycena sanguinolenta]